MTPSEHWEQFSAYRPMIEDAIDRGRKQPDFSRVNRVEVIDSNGRAYVAYDVEPTIMLQDDGRTLKVFVDRK